MPRKSKSSAVKPWQVSPNATLAEMAGDFAFASGLLRGTLPLDDTLPGAATLRLYERAKLIELCGRLATIGEQAGVDATALLRLQQELPERVERSTGRIVTAPIAASTWHAADIVVARVLRRGARTAEVEVGKKKKWDHVWKLIQKRGAETGIGEDQAIANKHNKICAANIKTGKCERIDAKKVAQIRYEHTHADRHQKDKKQS